MSVIIQTRGEAGGGVAAHLQCPHCGHFSKSHAQQLSHMAATHPACLDSVSMGRLGNILMYQSSGRLFHCSDCFYTSKDFTKLYKHIIAKHCMDEREGGGAGCEARDDGSEKGEEEEEEEEGVKEDFNKKRSSEGKEEEGVKDDLKKTSSEGGKEGKEEEKDAKDALGQKRSSEGGETELEGVKNDLNRKRSSEGEMEEEKDGVKDALGQKRSGEGEEEQEEGVKDSRKRKRSSKGEEEGAEEDPKRKRSSEDEEGEGTESVKPADEEEEKTVLMFDGGGYRCLICGWRHKQKAVGVSHVVRKHDIPKAYASQAIRRDCIIPKQLQGGGAEDDEGAGMSEEMLMEEMKATAKVVRFISSRFVCLICGWKTKLKGFAISHVVRSHDVERPYSCKDCSRSFFLPSRLQQHIRAAHRPGRYACPFCCFRSQFLGGFRRHCSRCNAREEEGGAGGRGGAGGGVAAGAGGGAAGGGVAAGAGGGAAGGGVAAGAGMEEDDDDEDEEGGEEKKGTRGVRKRRSSGRLMEEEDNDDD